MQKKNLKISNDFVNSVIRKNNELSFKILFYCVLNGKIDEQEELSKIEVSIKQLKKDVNLETKNLMQNLEKVQKTIITIKDRKDITQLSLVPKAEYVYSKQILVISVFTVVLKELKDLKNKFTIIDLNNLIQLKNKHSIRLLTLLEHINSYSSNASKSKYLTKAELNDFFGTNYKGLKEIERAVLKPIKEEMDQYSKLTFIYDLEYDTDTSIIGRKPLIGITLYLVENKQRQLKMF